MKENYLPDFPYGGVYFRYSNPPEEDWARDYQTAAEDGMNIFRHWFLWSGIEVAPGEFDWSYYDKQLDLAAKNNMKTIIAEMITVAPEWAFRKYAHARYETSEGKKINSHMHAGCATGGAPGLCLDNEDVKKAAGNFLRKLIKRYYNHPGLGGYDVWNECFMGGDICYCPATAEKFREWLKEKYKDLKALGKAWYRPSFSQWEDVMPPRSLGPYPDTLDWLKFRIDNAYQLMKWRINIIKEIDPDHPINAHGIAGSLGSMAPWAADDWRAAKEIDNYGLTWVASRKGDEPWRQWYRVDLTRAASKGKPFWHTEAQGGPLWMQPQVINRPRTDGRITYPEDIRLWNMSSFAAGATGMFYVRWRSLLDGPLFGAFGLYGMDGSRNSKTKIASKIANWITDEQQQELREASPVKGDLGIIFVPEAQLHCYAQQGNTNYYEQSMKGVYRGFFDNNIQADWVHINDINQYKLLYLPYPVMLEKENVKKIMSWVKKGGRLVVEGCPGYFGDRGKAGTVQPNNGLDKLFGCQESYVEFTPDILEDLTFNINGNKVYGGLFLQSYNVTEGQAIGWYEDGRVAVVDNNYGAGKVRLIGTFPGAGYFNHEKNNSFFSNILTWAGREQHLRVSDYRIIARLQKNNESTFLWIVNPSRVKVPVLITCSSQSDLFNDYELYWGKDCPVKVESGKIKVTVNRRDAVVIKLK